MNRYLLVAGAAALVLVGCNKSGPAADNAASTAAPAHPDAVALAGSPSDADPLAVPAPVLVENAGVDDMFEMKASELAAKKSKSNDVKGYAKALADDHKKSFDALKDAIKDAGKGLEAPTELSEEKEAMLSDLDKVPDTLFDTMYLTQQVTLHSDLENLLTHYAAAGGEPAIKTFAGKMAPDEQKHLDRAHAIQTKLAK